MNGPSSLCVVFLAVLASLEHSFLFDVVNPRIRSNVETHGRGPHFDQLDRTYHLHSEPGLHLRQALSRERLKGGHTRGSVVNLSFPGPVLSLVVVVHARAGIYFYYGFSNSKGQLTSWWLTRTLTGDISSRRVPTTKAIPKGAMRLPSSAGVIINLVVSLAFLFLTGVERLGIDICLGRLRCGWVPA